MKNWFSVVRATGNYSCAHCGESIATNVKCISVPHHSKSMADRALRYIPQRSRFHPVCCLLHYGGGLSDEEIIRIRVLDERIVSVKREAGRLIIIGVEPQLLESL